MLQHKSAPVRVKDFQLDVKAVEDDGRFSGYGSVFGSVDRAREVVARGAFTESLADLKAKGRTIPVLWQHRIGEPIGIYDKMFEDEHGLRVEGRLLKEDVTRAREAFALLKAGAVTGLSIGYIVREDAFDQKERIRTLKKLDLVEVSLVTVPAHDEARVDAIKMKLAHGTVPDLPEFERFLREAGFSKTQAAVIANRGLKHLLRSESEGHGDKQASLEELRGLSLPKLGD